MAGLAAQSPADVREANRMFNLLDKDGNGWIEKSELKYVVKTVCRKPSEEIDTVLSNLMSKMGADRDGRVDREHFKDFFLGEFVEDREQLVGLCERFSLKEHEENLGRRFRELGYHALSEALDRGDRDSNAELFQARGSISKFLYKEKRLEELNAMVIALDMSSDGEAGPVEVLARRLTTEDPDTVAKYLKQAFKFTGSGNRPCRAQAIHLAAAWGKKDALLRLVAACPRGDRPGLVSARARFDENPHATPLHDAAWFQHADVVLELLDKKADVGLADNKGMAPLHLAAEQGEDEQTVAKMINGLLKAKADLEQKVTNRDPFAFASHGKTAFTIAADRALSKKFPMEALHLLTRSFAEARSDTDLGPAARGALFHDVSVAAKKGLEAGEALVQALLDAPYKGIAFKQAMGRGGRDEVPSVLHLLAKLTIKFPMLGAKLLGALTDTPEVEDAKNHGLPTRVNLSNFTGLPADPMVCAYVPDVSGESGRPQWKKPKKEEPVEVAGAGPAASTALWQSKWLDKKGHTENYPVKVEAIHLPNVLDKQMVQALALTDSSCLEIFATKSVQAVVIAGWDQVRRTYGCDLLFNSLVLLLILLIAGCDSPEAWKHYVWFFLLSAAIHDCAGLCSVLWAFLQNKKELDESDKTSFRDAWQLPSFNWGFDAAACIPLTVFVILNFFEQNSEAKGYEVDFRPWLSLTFLMRCLKIMAMLRGWFTGFNAFFSAFLSLEVMNISVFVALSFLMFWGVFVVLSGVPSKMLDSCIKALLFSEWSGVDDLETAHGNLSKVLAFLCVALFTFCFNNLFTAVFSDKYKDDGRISRVIFLQERARLTLKYLYWRQGARDARGPAARWARAAQSWAWSWCSALVALAAAMLNMLGVAIFAGAVAVVIFAGAVAVAVGATWVVLTRDGRLEAPEGCRRFVWLCYREDFDSDVFQYGSLSDEACKIEKIKQSLDKQAKRSEETELKREREMEKVHKDTYGMEKKIVQLANSAKNQVAQLEDKLAAVDGNVSKILDILSRMPVQNPPEEAHSSSAP